eukprot:15348679-Ditylum_brightwellii.AAC.1
MLEGWLEDLRVKTAPNLYREYLEVLKDFQGYGFKVSPHDPCIVNKMKTSHSSIMRQITLPLHTPTASCQEVKSDALHDLIAGAIAGSAGIIM